jgi:hypothetical protein
MRYANAALCLATALPLCALLLSACPRQYPAGLEPATGKATHPWELKEWRSPLAAKGGNAAAAQSAANEQPAAVDLPPEVGPELPSRDTLDVAKLPGAWLQVCQAAGERLSMPPPGETDGLELFADGRAVYHAVAQGKSADSEGRWSKPKPGRLMLPMGGPVAENCFGMLYRDEFLYLWNQPAQTGDWFVRIPRVYSDRIMANRFSTSLGDLLITSNVGQSFSGTVAGESKLDVAGFYYGGIIGLRWEDQKNKAAGYAAFHVDQDWNSLYGALWLDDYQAQPFTAAWDGTRSAATGAESGANPSPAQ